MKNFAIVSLFASMIACGSNAQNSESSSAASKPHSRYSFTVDNRLLDGNFQNITVTKDEYGTYIAKYHEITSGFGSPITDTTQEFYSLECVETKAARKLQKLACAVDLRPADGQLVELTLTRNEAGTYDAVLHTASYGNLIAPASDITRDLAFGLIRQN
jgi:hypothetical protein